MATPSTSLKPFEEFLAELLREWLREQLDAGRLFQRYQFRSPNQENGRVLFEALRRQCDRVVYEGDARTELPYFNERDTMFIPVLCGTQVGTFTENYVSHLRDTVASRRGAFSNSALIVIHDSLLDTLVNSAENIGSQGSVWHPTHLKTRLLEMLGNDRVSRLLLEQRLEQVVADGDTVFGLKPIYQALDDGLLEFSELGLINDPLLLKMDDSDAQIKKRLEKNKELMDRINFLRHTYPDQFEERLQKESLSESFIRKHFKDDSWKGLTFADFLKEKQRNKKQRVTLKDTPSSKSIRVIARPKSMSAAGQRDQALLLVQDEPTDSQHTLFVTFDGDPIKTQEIILDTTLSPSPLLEVKARGGVSRLSLQIPPVSEPYFFRLELKRDKISENHIFQCLSVPANFLYLESIKNIFRVDADECRLILLSDENTIKVNPTGSRTFTVSGSEDIVSCDDFDVIDIEEVSHQSDLVLFELRRGEYRLNVQVESEDSRDSVALPHLLNIPPSSIGLDQKTDAEIIPERAKLVVRNSEVTLIARRLEILRLEHSLVSQGTVAVLPNRTASIDDLKEADPELGEIYDKLFHYYSVNATLPSLVGWNKEYSSLVQSLLTRYLTVLGSLAHDKILSEAHKLIVQLGFIHTDDHGECIAPFSPLTLAYHLELASQAKDDRSFNELPQVTLSRLTPAGLIPYLYTPNVSEEYAHVVPLEHNRAWLQAVGKTNSGLNFVRKLVRDKIREFVKAYSSLFANRKRGTLRINCVNLGRAEEFLKGLLDYYSDNLESSLDIHVNFFDEQLVTNAFDDFADASSGQEIREFLDIEREKNADLLVHLLRTRVTYSKFLMEDDQQYAHLAFFCNVTPVIFDQCTLTSSISGVLADGLLSGTAAEREGGAEQAAYFSGFGLRGVSASNYLLRISKHLNCLLRPARRPTPTQYLDGVGCRLTVNTKFREDLRETYQNAIWTVLVDPKVNLDFFAVEPDVVLIHFSDQYTSSSEYDAITVTQERDLFTGVAGDDIRLSELNAFNGVWLLEMLKASDKTKKERRGIIAAYKFLYSLLVREDISWVPLSVAEMIRVTGNLGLKMRDSDFSRNVQGYRNGAISDDVLFVGFTQNRMVILPLEVKAGSVPNYKHASAQAKELARYLGEEILGPKNLKGKLYRSLFMRQVFMQVEKYELYDVFAASQLSQLNDNREFWLAGDFDVCELKKYAKGVVIALVEGQSAYEPRFKKENDVLFAELPYSLLKELMVAELKEDPEAVAALCKPDACYLLRNLELELTSFQPKTEEASDEDEPSSLDDTSIEEDKIASHSITESVPATIERVEQEVPENPSVVNSSPVSPPPPTPAASKASPVLATGIHALLGHNVIGDAPLVWEPTNTAKFLNPNSGIIGTMGTGKTQFTKSLVTQLVKTQNLNVGGKPPGILIFDYKSDYVDEQFLKATGGRKFMPYKLPYNPLSIHGSMPMLPVHTAGGFVDTMGRAYHLGPKQRLRLRDVILEAYENCGISRSDPATWSLPAPTIEKVWRKFDADEKIEKDSLYAALRELADYKIFEDETDKLQSLYNLVSGVTVIKLAGFSPDLQNLIVGLTLDQFYAQMQKSGKPELDGDHRQLNKLILVDEADNFMSQDFPALRKILKEGREYGVGVVLSTQDIKHFKTSENDYTAYILTWIVHRVAQIEKKSIKSIFNIDDKNAQDRLMEDVRQLEKHYSIYIDGEKNLVKMKDRAFWELMAEARCPDAPERS